MNDEELKSLMERARDKCKMECAQARKAAEAKRDQTVSAIWQVWGLLHPEDADERPLNPHTNKRKLGLVSDAVDRVIPTMPNPFTVKDIEKAIVADPTIGEVKAVRQSIRTILHRRIKSGVVVVVNRGGKGYGNTTAFQLAR